MAFSRRKVITRARTIGPRAARRCLVAADGWLRSQTMGRLPRDGRVAVTRRAVDMLRAADRASGYRVGTVHGAHLNGIIELFDLGAYVDAMAASDEVMDDCADAGRPLSVAALRARGERARCLVWLDRPLEAIEEFELVLSLAGDPPSIGAPWSLSLRYCLALARRDLGDLDGSTNDLRGLVPDMIGEFGQDSTWMVSTVLQLARNVAQAGDTETAIEMVIMLLPVSTRLRGPMSKEALTLRSRVARWTILDGDRHRGKQLASQVLVDMTAAGLSTCSEACELRYDYAEALFDDGDVRYAVAQLASLDADLEGTEWSGSSFAESVRADLDTWRTAHHDPTE